MNTLDAEQRALMQWARSRRADAPAPPALTVPTVRGEAHAHARLRTVREMLWLRQVQALASTYPRSQDALGESRFKRVAAAFIAQHPSCHADLEDAGALLPSFLAVSADASHRATSGLARIEWAVCLAFRAPDVRSVSPDNAGRCVVALAPATQLLAFDSEELPAAVAGFPQLASVRAEQRVLVTRTGMRVRVRSVEEHERWVLERAARCAPLHELCAHAGLVPAELAAVLLPLLRSEIIALQETP